MSLFVLQLGIEFVFEFIFALNTFKNGRVVELVDFVLDGPILSAAVWSIIKPRPL